MTVEDIENDLIEFNKKLDQLERAYGIEVKAKAADGNEADAILANPYVDGLISFETKVMFLANYFEVKHQEIVNIAAKQ